MAAFYNSLVDLRVQLQQKDRAAVTTPAHAATILSAYLHDVAIIRCYKIKIVTNDCYT